MVKEKRILSYFMSWLIVGFIVCFVGITNVFADEIEKIGYLDNKTEVKVVVPYNGSPLTLDQYGEYYLNDVDELLIFIDNYDFIGGDIYQLELYLPNATLTNANTFTVTGTTSNNETVSCSALKILQENKQFVNYRWRCQKDVNSLTFNIKNSNDENIVSAGIFRWDYSYLLKVTSTTDNSEIIDGLNKVEQSIIDSNKETQEVIKDQFNSCRPGNNLFNLNNWYNSLTSNNGTISLNEDSIEFIAISNSMTNIISTYNFKLKPSTTYTLSFNANIENSFEYNTWLNLGLQAIDNVSYGTLYINSNGYYTKTFTTNQNGDFYLKGYVNTNVNNNNQLKLILNNIMLNEGSSAKTYEKYGEICSNKIDDTNDKLDDLNGSLNDSNIDGSLNNAGGFFNNFSTSDHGGLSGIITAPLVAINQMLNTSCSPMTTTFKGKELSLPCGYEFWNKMGPIQDFINLVLGGLLCYQIIIKLYKLIEKIKNPEDDRLEVMNL